jgi:hypothetical protein
VGPAIHEERGSLGDALVNVVGHPVTVLSPDERTDVNAWLVSWSDDELARLLTQRVEEGPRGVPDGHRDTAG